MKRNHKVIITLMFPTFGAVLYKQVIEPIQQHKISADSSQVISISEHTIYKPTLIVDEDIAPYSDRRQPKEESNGSAPIKQVTSINENKNKLAPDLIEKQLTALITEFKEKTDLKPLDLKQDKFFLQKMSQSIWETTGAKKLNVSQSLLESNLPSDWSDALNRLTRSLHLEETLHNEWQDRIYREPGAFKKALLKQQKAILGETLFSTLYADESEFKISQDAIHGQYLEDSNSSAQKHQAKNSEENIESEEQEAIWLSRLADFLEEYQYIEQSGISDNDADLVREELIERHFAPEEQSTIKSFLFNQDSPNLSLNEDNPGSGSTSQLEANL